MQEFKLDGRMTVASMKDLFKTLTGGTLRVKDGGRKADESATVASIRKESDNKSGAFALNPEMTVGDFKAKMLSDFGLKVEVGTPDDWVSVPDGITLGQLRELPKNAVKAQLEALVVGGTTSATNEKPLNECTKDETSPETNAENEEGPFIEENPFDMDVYDEVEDGEEYDENDDDDEEEDEEDWNDEEEYNEDEEETEKYGIIDRDGDYIVEPIYDNINEFHEGLAIVTQDDKYGVINKGGEIVVEPQYDRIYDFEDGLATFELDDKYGIIDKEGNIVVKPQYDRIGNFEDGLAKVWIGGFLDNTRKIGLINRDGKVVVEPSYYWIDDFHNGLASVEIDHKFGYIDKTGKVVVEPKYDKVGGNFKNGFAVVYSGEERYFIDMRGNVITDMKPYADIDEIELFYDGTIHKYGYRNAFDEIVIEAKFKYANEFVNGAAIVETDEDSALINKKGETLLQFESISDFSEGLAAFMVKDEDGNYKYGYMDEMWNVVIAPQYDSANDFSEGLALVIRKEPHFYGYIDKTGKVIIDTQSEWAHGDFHEGLARAVYGKNCVGFINKKGKYVIKPRFVDTGDFCNGLAVYIPYVDAPTEGLINKEGQIVVKAKFYRLDLTDEDVIIVSVSR